NSPRSDGKYAAQVTAASTTGASQRGTRADRDVAIEVMRERKGRSLHYAGRRPSGTGRRPLPTAALAALASRKSTSPQAARPASHCHLPWLGTGPFLRRRLLLESDSTRHPPTPDLPRPACHRA